MIVYIFVVWLSLSLTSAFGTPGGINANENYNSAASRSPLFRREAVNCRDLDRGAAVHYTSLSGGSFAIKKTGPPPSNDTEDDTPLITTTTTNLPSFLTSQHPCSAKDQDFIRQSLLDNVMFSSLPNATLTKLVNSFEPASFQKDECIMYQGDPSEGNYVYLMATGECTVLMDGKVAPEPYGTLRPRAIVGEMGVLYDKPRSATIRVKSENVTLFRINGDTLKSVINQHGSTCRCNKDDPELLEKIDKAINQVAGTKSRYDGDGIIRQFKPHRRWLWRQWQGTVLQLNHKVVLGNMLVSLGVICGTRLLTGSPWNWGLRPDAAHPIIQIMETIRKLWSYQASLTTFILTFFVSQAYGFWKDVYQTARTIQANLSEIHQILATHSQRDAQTGSYTKEAEQLMDDVGHYTRLFHVLFWASCARRFNVLRTPQGLERMATRGLISSRQLKVLESLDIPNHALHNAPIEWIMIRANEGMTEGALLNDGSVRDRLLELLGELRGLYDSVGGKLVCRMPLPYTHFVQILVDTFVMIAPVALYPDLGFYSVFCVGVLTLFYTGLMDLAKVFLDPLDNDDFTQNSIDMDVGVFIRESNAASIRFKNAAATLPFDVAP